MKYQQVSVDLVNMVVTACSYLALAGAAWILLRLLQACFWLPRHLRKQNDVQKMLQDKVDSYEKYLEECEARDKLLGIDEETKSEQEDGEEMKSLCNTAEKWKEQRECLEMLKRELNRVRDGGNINEWDYLLEENSEISGNLGEMNEEETKDADDNKVDDNGNKENKKNKGEKEKINTDEKKEK